MAEAHPWGEHAPGMQESLLGDQSSADPTLTPSESMAGCSARGDMSGEHSDTVISNLSQGLCAADCPWTHQGTFSVCSLQCFSFQALKVFFLCYPDKNNSQPQALCVAQNPGSSGCSLSDTTLWHSHSQATFTWAQHRQQDGKVGLHFGPQTEFGFCHPKQVF